MTLSDRACKYINEYAEDIDNNVFQNLYSDLIYEDDETLTPEITAAFISCGIDPLETLDFIPANYFRKHLLDEVFIVPKGIKTIGTYSFNSVSGLKTVFIPEGCENIYVAAFAGAKDLRHIYIPYTVTTFGGMCIPDYVTIHCVQNSDAEEFAKHIGCKYVYDYRYLEV